MDQDLPLIKFVIAKNKLPDVAPVRFPSGVINRVYDLGKCVIKIEGSDMTNFAKGVLKPQPPIINKLVDMGAKVPKIVDYGEFAGRPYLLMEKAPGQNLIYDWLDFSPREKESFIAQICEQLQIFHSLKFDHYNLSIYSAPNFDNLQGAIENAVDFGKINKGQLKAEYRDSVEVVERFFAENVSRLNERNTAALIHDDIHLENVFHQGDKISAIIDFDWITAAPPDFELWKIADVFYDPKKYTEKGLESLYKGYRMTEEFKFIKKHYPALFASPDLLTRIRLFSAENVIFKVTDYQNGRWSENVMISMQKQIREFYKPGGWLEEVLS